jgi:hypothetical protein
MYLPPILRVNEQPVTEQGRIPIVLPGATVGDTGEHVNRRAGRAR